MSDVLEGTQFAAQGCHAGSARLRISQDISGYLQCLSISLTDLQQSSTSRLHLATTLLKAL